MYRHRKMEELANTDPEMDLKEVSFASCMIALLAY